MTDKCGQVHEIEVTIYGWKLSVLIDGRTKIPLAGKVVPINEHKVLSMRALVTQARTNVAGHARLHKVVFERGCLDGVDLWWLDQHGMTFVVPAKDNMAVTADARAQAAAGEGITRGRRVHTIRHGQGRAARPERLETKVVGITGLTTYDQYGTPEHGRAHNRRDCEANPINAVVVRQWHGRDYGPGGQTVFLTNASVQQPLQPFDEYDDRSLIENCCIKEAKKQWELRHSPQKTDRAVRVHVVFTLLMFALAPSAAGAHAEPGDRVCPGRLWHVPYSGVFLIAGSAHQRSPSWDRHTAATLGQIQAHSRWLSLYPNFRECMNVGLTLVDVEELVNVREHRHR
jgi:hypothetical protein